MEHLKKLAELSVKRSGLPVLLSFEDDYTSPSSGTYSHEDNKINLNLFRLKLSFEKLNRIGFNISTIERLMDLVLSHELGHAYDEKTSGSVSLSHKHRQESWNAAVSNNKELLSASFRNYKKINFECEEKAWDYSTMFQLYKHDPELYKKHREYCLDSYRKTYHFQYKKLHISRRLILDLEKTRMMKHYIKNVLIELDAMFSSFYDVDNHRLNISIGHLKYWKPSKLNIPNRDYYLFQSVYKYCQSYRKSKEEERTKKIGELYSSVGKTLTALETKESLDLLEQEAYLDERHTLNMMQRALELHNHSDKTKHSFNIFRNFKLNDVKEDYEGTFDLFKGFEESRLKRKTENIA